MKIEIIINYTKENIDEKPNEAIQRSYEDLRKEVER